MRFLRLAPLFILLICAFSSAEVTVPPIFGEHMVLQRGIDVPVWGTANPNERVTVEVAGVSGSAAADADGNWIVRLQPLAPPARADVPVEMTIKGETGQPIVLRDVLVGDVWICSGQSNMQWPLTHAANADEALALYIHCAGHVEIGGHAHLGVAHGAFEHRQKLAFAVTEALA